MNAGNRVEFGETVETAFAALEECLDKFLQRAPVRHISQLCELIPDIAPANQRLILIELIKVDMSIADELGMPRAIEFYLDALGERLARDQVPLDLVMEEIQLRRNAGEEPVAADYLQRFPHLENALREMLRSNESTRKPSWRGRPPELQIGQSIDDFTLLNLLGRGAFASVYLARQESMQRLVALKVSTRAGEEPQALAQLDHPNIVRVYDHRVCGDPACLLLYMQYIPGGTLAEVIGDLKNATENATGPITGRLLLDSIDRCLLSANQSAPERSEQRDALAAMDWPTSVAWLGVQLAEGLGYAHKRGVLHRDVKPANVLVSADGVPKLADFNVSHSSVGGSAGAAAHFGGSLAYMSPEQLRVADVADRHGAEELDGRSDLYSLGLLLWELWQGKRPWDTPSCADSWSAAVGQQRYSRTQVPREPTRFGGAAERVLERALRHGLHCDAVQRPRNGDEFAGRLRLALYPTLAERFEPQRGSLSDWLLKLPVLVTTSCIVFVPNSAAVAFIFYYNWKVINYYAQFDSSLPDKFFWLAVAMNASFFSLAAIVLTYFSTGVSRALQRAKKGEAASQKALGEAWLLGTRAAVIGGLLWMIAGCIFAIILSWLSEQFTSIAGWNFFVSHAICGGIAWIYPFFGASVLCVFVYYPRLVSVSMTDDGFTERARTMCRRLNWYLISAAVFPLTALALLVVQPLVTKIDLLLTVMTTALGLFASFAAYQKLELGLREMSQVLGKRL